MNGGSGGGARRHAGRRDGGGIGGGGGLAQGGGQPSGLGGDPSGGGLGSGQPGAQGNAGGGGQQPGSGNPLLGGLEPGGGGEAAPEAMRIVPNPQNNALLIYATPQERDTIETTLRRLDILPLQVRIDAVIAEVTLNDALQYGTQFFFRTGEFNNVLTTAATATAGERLSRLRLRRPRRDRRAAGDLGAAVRHRRAGAVVARS